ncbi:hypothetical protein BBO99_00009052 [Phytophthora kernoviae]|uniref:SCP domain-containing protein n=2 Tax=Phytophthora kernoviae TaxID=325452 RepID=A0A3R7GQZ9_9STRA|nr:hypothetical protein G195_010492 [Phytophthora kernoviae 00238/432]KAG2508041.1 hypothetical protein JM16_008822 [Phytophthora kernoviae]KAG2510620.1 hypothetical protein JM18_008864 [Phytophthora kernoviae]RLN06159.1 hypothetical protein BBI17_008978 [Phytophthora kernoviae]RLN74201.1 hypothetical protein BBO99_00009052 [Phytophthora kernoviae]
MSRFRICTLIVATVIATISSVPTTAAFQRDNSGRVMWENNCDFARNDYRSVLVASNGINAYRSQYSLSALTIDYRLVAAAQLHSQDQASHCRMTHTGSNGSSMGDRINAQNYNYNTAAENVASGQATVEEVMIAWWNSPEHRANILNKDVVNVGFAKDDSGGCGNYWTQDFGRLA